ncbi:MAG TPA: murein biosynthesis integral membrane protein MurJ [Clostridiaceae bacterium]|nr:murein biosynthesis integral membrane protein MurJ [Clostridiaceae bacterium]
MSKLQKKSLSSAAAIVMSSVVVSRITGFIREMLIPTKFGVSEIGDMYNIAFLVPDLMYSLLIGGAVSAALIPILSGYLGRNEEEEGWRAVNTFINVIFIASVLACLAGIVFTPQLIKLVSSGYNWSIESNQMELVVKLTRTLFPSVAFLMLAGLCNGVLNSYNRFAAAAFGPSVYNLLSAASIYFLSNNDIEDNYGVEKVVVGVMLSALAYFLFQMLFAIKNLRNYRPVILLKHSGFRRLFSLAIPSMLSSSVAQINLIISSRFATFFDEGSVTALRMADRTWQMPLGIIAQGMGVAILPTLSAEYARGEVSEYKSTLMKGLKTVLFLSIPSAVGILVLNKPIVRTIFRFSENVSEADVSLTGNILTFFTIALVFQSMTTILNRCFYAINDTKTPLYLGTCTIMINVILSTLFINYTDIGVAGMALAYSLSATVNALALLIILDKKAKRLNLSNFLHFITKIFLCSTIMGIILLVADNIIGKSINIYGINLSHKLLQLFSLIIEVGIGGLVYFLATILLKVEEAINVYRTIINKIRNINILGAKQ